MPKRTRISKILQILLILVFIFTPIKFENLNLYTQEAQGASTLYITEDTVWKKADNITLNGKVTIKNGATLTIEKGATITIGINRGNSAFIYVFDGNIVAEGTKDEKITFNVAYPGFNSYGIFFRDSGNNDPSFFRYVDFINGGYYPISVFQNKGLINKAYAAPMIGGAVTYGSGKVHIENSEFKNSFNGAVNFDVYENSSYPDGNYLEIVNSNFKDSKSQIAIVASHYCETGSCKTRLTLENNWYGNYAGPESGERVLGDCPLPNFRNNDLISDPTIIIPGIMGSFEVDGILFLDPVMKIYDNLVRSLEQNGYQKNINLFDFPYEWRNSNALTAGELKNKIQEIKNLTKVSKVDLVAHSMGGLVSRSYIEGPNYQNDVDQLITLGTPHKGSPEAYLKWEAAEGFEDLLGKLVKKIFSIEAKHNGYDDLEKYIREKVVSVGELLPDYNYLEENGVPRDYPIGYPENEFLEGLNDPSNLANLRKVDFTNIVSQNKSTISKFRVVASTETGKWEHGIPENYYDPRTDKGIDYGAGDETVPLESSTGIVSNGLPIVLDATHNQLPSKAQCKILVELSNKAEKDCLYINDVSEIISILTFGVFSPIDIQVVAPDGKKVGKDFATGEIINEIDGAYYTGSGAENEFLTIPNPTNGEYKILTQGTRDGEYKIEVAKIIEDPETGIASESTAEIIGNATLDQKDEKAVNVEGDAITIENQDITPPTITGSATTQPNASGWYNSDVTIHFEATDNESRVDFVTPDVTITTEGKNQSVTGIAKDKVGNEASLIVSGINIDKTAPSIEISSPEAKIYLNNQIVGINYTVLDNLSQNIQTEVTLDGNVFVGTNIDLAFQNLGEHAFKITAQDKAVNQGEKEIKFMIITSIDAIINNINNHDWITDLKIKDNLLHRLEIIKQLQGLVPKNSNAVNAQINIILKDVQKYSNSIDKQAQELLISSLNFVKY